jgi:polar amino acid transport system substrate-binding protein
MCRHGQPTAGILFLCVAAIVAVGRSAHAEALAEVRARGVLVWGGDLQGGEPYVFENPDDVTQVIGFEVDIAGAIARRMRLESARFTQVQWSNLVPTLERGDIDVALNGLEDSPERRARLRLSRPYFVFRDVLAVERGSPYRTLEDLRGKRVATLNQTSAFELLRALPVETVLYEGQQEPYFDLQNGRVHAVLLDNIIADRYGCPLAGVECLANPIAQGTYVVGMRRGDEMLAGAVDDALARIIADGELRRILERWHLWDETQQLVSGATPALDLAAHLPPTLEGGYRTTSPTLDWKQTLLFLDGAAVTVLLSISAFAIAMPLGALLATARSGASLLWRTVAAGYVELLRGTPVLLQLYVLYFGLAPVLKLGPMTAAVLGLGLNYAAYEAEVYRGAILAIPRGQIEAAAVLGLGRIETLRHVILPQALRIALPAITNDFVALLKDSSLVSVLTVIELTKRMTIAAVEVRSWLGPGILCAAFYFVMSFPLSRLSQSLEKKLQRDSHPRIA